MQLEVDFFSAQPLEGSHWPQATDTFLVMDFDDTMTTQQSPGVIIEAAISCCGCQAWYALSAWHSLMLIAKFICLLVQHGLHAECDAPATGR